jgi:hypothetical protein
VGTSGSIYVPKDAAVTCAAHCQGIGLTMTAVVVMANNVGCVCSAAGPSIAGATAGGMAALIVQEQQSRANKATK